MFSSQGDPLEIDVETEEEGSFKRGQMLRRAAESAAAAVKEELRAEVTQQLAEARAALLREIEAMVRFELADIRSAFAELVPAANLSSQGCPPHPSVDTAGRGSQAEYQVAPSHEHVAIVRGQQALQKRKPRNRGSIQ